MPTLVGYVVLAIVASVFVVYSAFMVLCTARSIEMHGVEMPKLVRFVAKFWLFVGLPADVIFNWTVGAWTFREWRGFTFSSHIQYRVDAGLWDHKTAMWTKFLNAGDPSGNHIKRVPA